MTPEEDNEDQSKYYLSYLPVLDRKWENHDINVVEWANIPKFLRNEWRLGENVVLKPMECLIQLLNLIYL